MGAGFPQAIAARLAAQCQTQFEVWPENLQPAVLFETLLTQWHVGLAGRTGLIYSEAFRLMDEYGIKKRRKRLETLFALQQMEDEALAYWAERSKTH